MQIELGKFYSRLGTIAIILALGYYLGRKKKISNQTNKDIISLLLMVFMPASLLVAFPEECNDELIGLFFAGLSAGAIVMSALIVLSKIIFNRKFYKGELRYESQFALIFNNATFLGYPIISSTFGEEGIVPYCGFIISFNIALFSYGVFLFERKVTKSLYSEIIKNPNIIAVVLGMFIFLRGITIPAPIRDAIQYTGNATTCLSLICIGVMLSHADFKAIIKKWRLIATAAIQLVIGPTVTFFLLRLINCPIEVVIVCTIIQALPTATSLGLFAAKYGGNDIESSELVAISTILSIVTMPLMIWMLLGPLLA